MFAFLFVPATIRRKRKERKMFIIWVAVDGTPKNVASKAKDSRRTERSVFLWMLLLLF